MNYPEGFCLEGWSLESWISWSTSPLKLLLHTSRIIFKSQTWHDKIQKKRWQVWNVGEPSTAIFPLLWYFCLLRKKTTSSMFSLRPVDQKRLKAQDLHISTENFSKSIKSWKTMKKLLEDQAFWVIQDHSISHPSQLSKHLESYCCNFWKEKSSLLHCISKYTLTESIKKSLHTTTKVLYSFERFSVSVSNTNHKSSYCNLTH